MAGLLLHVCCAPCLSRSLAGWRAELGLPDGSDRNRPPAELPGQGLFFNPNIHPLLEYRRRRKALAVYAERDPFPVALEGEYALDDFLTDLAAPAFPTDPGDAAEAPPALTTPAEGVAVWQRPRRCARCFARRLDRTAARARAEGFEAFGTTLAASREQNRDLVEAIGHWAARRQGVPFHWRDWREYEAPERLAKGLYRQSYCGCVFSENDRYAATNKHLSRPPPPGRPGSLAP